MCETERRRRVAKELEDLLCALKRSAYEEERRGKFGVRF